MSNLNTSIAMFALGFGLSFGAVHVMTSASADPATTYNDQCVDCHELADFEGLTSQDVTEHLLGVMSGAERHPPIDLTDEDAALMAEFLVAR